MAVLDVAGENRLNAFLFAREQAKLVFAVDVSRFIPVRSP